MCCVLVDFLHTLSARTTPSCGALQLGKLVTEAHYRVVLCRYQWLWLHAADCKPLLNISTFHGEFVIYKSLGTCLSKAPRLIFIYFYSQKSYNFFFTWAFFTFIKVFKILLSILLRLIPLLHTFIILHSYAFFIPQLCNNSILTNIDRSYNFVFTWAFFTFIQVFKLLLLILLRSIPPI